MKGEERRTERQGDEQVTVSEFPVVQGLISAPEALWVQKGPQAIGHAPWAPPVHDMCCLCRNCYLLAWVPQSSVES